MFSLLKGGKTDYTQATYSYIWIDTYDHIIILFIIVFLYYILRPPINFVFIKDEKRRWIWEYLF